ncbi:MAG: glycerophosphodiester phosphodiesterase [Actinomycetota bacterium]|nr:glycerophosphodiester phosphodiesterase [Actinomycetota bacterium]
MPASQPSCPLIIAHRGASAHRAEHTLAAYLLALEQGADGLECDVRLTRDGHLVCVHDRRIDRTSTGRGAVSAMDYTALATYEFGSWHDELPDSADDLVHRRVGEPVEPPEYRRLLTLAELLELVMDFPRPVQLFVETKHPVRHSGLVEATLVALLVRFGLTRPSSRYDSPVVVMSFSSRALRRVRAAAPPLPTVLLLKDRASLRWGGRLPPWADIVGPSIRAVRAHPDHVECAARLGNPTYCWTVDEPADLDLCREVGVRYLATNRPASARWHLRPPPAAPGGGPGVGQ